MRITRYLGGAVGIALVACGGGGGDSNPTAPEADPPVGTNSVSVGPSAFTPRDIAVAVGSTVTWTWASGGIEHNVTFASGPSSPSQSTGSFTRTFPTTGTFPYTCTIHGGSMSGSVTVGGTPGGGGGGGGGGDNPDTPDNPYDPYGYRRRLDPGRAP